MRQADSCRLVLLIAIQIFLAGSPAAAGEPTGLPVLNVSVQHDVHFTRINAVYEDSIGYLWFATGDGLARFDGVEFKVYRHDVNDQRSIAHHNVFAIDEDANGDIWVATTYGVSKLDRTGETFSHYYLNAETRYSKSSNTVTELAFDRNGTLWCAGHSGLYRLAATGNFTRMPTERSAMEGASVRDLFRDPSGDLWCATSIGMFTIESGSDASPRFRKVHEGSIYCNQIAAQAGDQLICATRDGIWRLDKTSGSFERLAGDDQFGHGVFYAVQVDSSNQIWAINSDGHIVQFHQDGTIKKLYSTLDASNATQSAGAPAGILEDCNGVLWIHTSTEIFKYIRGYPNFRRILGHDTKGKSNSIHRVVSAADGAIWTLSEGRLMCARNGLNNRQIEVGPPGSYAGDWILEDAQHRIWVAVVDHGLYVMDQEAKMFRKARLDGTMDRAYIYRMIQDATDPNVIWVGTRNGLARIQTATMTLEWFDPVRDMDGLPTSRVAIFDQNASGEIWLYNTYYGSLSHFDATAGKFVEVRPSTGQQQVLKGDVKDIAVDDNAVWIATLFGLTRYDLRDSMFTIYTSRDGLHANGIVSLVNADSTLWLAGNEFLAALDKDARTFRNYHLSQQSFNFNSKSRSSNGQQLFFGCQDGVIVFEPGAAGLRASPPRVVITRVLVNDSAVVMSATSQQSRILLTHQENDIEFHFTGFNSVSPQRNRYRCMLDGYDTQWRELGSTRLVRYTNLNHGDYTFRVTAANEDGIASAHVSSVGLTITPAYWQTQWFRALVILCLAMIAYFLVRIRQHQLTLQKEKAIAERASEYKSSFLANVSHEIRTPMNAIMGMSELAIETEDAGRKDEYLGTISTASHDLLSIINELLDHSKLESGNFVFESVDFSLAEILHQLQMTFGDIARRRGLEFNVVCDSPIPQLKGDPKRLRQILVNLLSNAIKYTAHGQVMLTVSRLQHSIERVDLKFVVTDTGAGIPKDKLTQVFERFETGSKDVNDASGSTGLGLHITRQLVERQDGTIEIDSEVGKGTTAVVRLSFSPGHDTPQERADQDGAYAIPSNLKVLVAEDSAVNRLLITRMLEKRSEGIDIRIAENGLEAVDWLARESFDLVLMDVKMPEMNGYQATQAIRSMAEPAKRNVPVIGVTASAMPEQIQQCLDSGMNDVVSKPITSAALLRTMERVLNAAVQ